MTTVIKKDTIQRILLDIKELIQNPLEEQGIYYKHDDEDILKGYAMIVGPKNTPYENGYFFFLFDFPSNYPYSPPKVTFLNYSNRIRYNPNYYNCGKVCLSVLNTWKGESWSSCQTISSILLILCITFQEKPIYNEPGISFSDIQSNHYNEIISYYTSRDALCLPITYIFKKEVKKELSEAKCYIDRIYLELFKNEIKSIFEKNVNEIMKHIQEKQKNIDQYKEQQFHCNMYSLQLSKDSIYYQSIYNFLDSIKIN